MTYSSGSFNYADYPVVIGIDFGTTYSGCCYAYARSENEEVFDLTKWPKQHNHVYPKTPTLSLYKKGSSQLADWGHGARRTAMNPNKTDHILLSKFKLFLDESLHQEERLPNNMNITDVIADYLRSFHQHVCTELQKGFSGNFTQDKFRYCLTVPAMWSDRAKSVMREAAIRAGIINRNDHPERLTLISEPEAAALYCEKKSEQFNLAHGQRFMICDAGGGTVDLIVFEIDQPPNGRRTLREVTNGQGGSCGSSFLDAKMREYIKDKFSRCGGINSTALETIMDNFVMNIKPEFDGIEDLFIELPASLGLENLTDPTIGLENGTLCLPAEELKRRVFEPVIVEVLDLIERQLRQSPNLEAIFLVGGFGQSNYLFRRVEEQFADRVGMIGVPPRGELAVVRGAVYFGLNPQIVTERVSRRTYGVETRMLFQEGLDPEEYSVIGVDDKKYCRQRFSVYVEKGQSIKVDECISKNFVISYPNDTDSDLFAFDGDGPPPRLTTHHLVQKVGHFPIRMPTLEGVKAGDKINMCIKMYFGLTEIKIECIIRDKVFVFTSAFDASDSFAKTAAGTPTPYDNLVADASQLSLHDSYPIYSPSYLPPVSQGYSYAQISNGETSAAGSMYSTDYNNPYAAYMSPQQQHPQQQQLPPQQQVPQQQQPSTYAYQQQQQQQQQQQAYAYPQQYSAQYAASSAYPSQPGYPTQNERF